MRNKIYNPYKPEILNLLSSVDIKVNNLTEIDNTSSESPDNTEKSSETSSAAKENKDFSKYFIFIIAIMGIMTVSYFAGSKNARDNVETKVSGDSDIISYNETSEIFFTVTQISSETNENKETGSKLYETPTIDTRNILITNFFSTDAISKINDKIIIKSYDGKQSVDVSEFVKLGNDGNIKSICDNKINVNEKVWNGNGYGGDYIKNNNEISLRAMYGESIVEMKFRIGIEDNQVYVYMILD